MSSGYKSVWALLAILGALALAHMVGVVNPNEKVNGLWLVVAAACMYVLAYRFYHWWGARSMLLAHSLPDFKTSQYNGH